MPSSHLSDIFQKPFGLLTDLYQLTMAYGYWKTGLYNRKAVFHLFFRKAPFNGHYAIASGLALVADYLQQFCFSPDDIQFLGGLNGADNQPLFDESFLNYLQRMRFSCQIDAVPEGTIIFPHEPLIRVEGPLIQAQIMESALLNLINFSTLISTKSARVVQAAKGDQVLEFGLRRAQGIDGSLTASRAAFIGGCHATSNVLAGKLFGIPVKGTHAHSWVMCFEDELSSFEAYARYMPNNCIFLVDTYDTIQGLKNAIFVSRELKERGFATLGIRLDSGHLAELSILARKMLDEAKLSDVAIIASNDLDEDSIKALKESGALITVWGIGTRLVTGSGQPALGGVYKLSTLEDASGKWEYKIKLSEQQAKVSTPGILQVKRYYDSNGKPVGDAIIDINTAGSGSVIIELKKGKERYLRGANWENLLIPIFRNGKLIYNLPSINDIRALSLDQQKAFAKINMEAYPYGLEIQLAKNKDRMIANAETLHRKEN